MSNQKDNQTIRIVKGSARYAGSPDNDLFIQLPLENSKKEIIEGDRTVLLNAEDRFNHERQISTKFRISGKIVNLMENTVSGSCSNYSPFENIMYYINPVDSVIQANGNLQNVIWNGYPQYDEFTFFRTKGIANHVDFQPKSASTYNWSIYVSYPYENNHSQNMSYTDDVFNVTNNFVVSDGVPYVIKNRKVNGKKMISFYCGYSHNLNVGEYIYLPNPVNNRNFFEVYSIGDEYYGNEDKIVNVYDYGFTGSSFNDGATGNFKRVLNPSNSGETMSQYYIRMHKTLSEVSNVDLTKMGFEFNNFPIKRQLEYSAYTPDLQQRISIKEDRRSFGFSIDKDIDIISLLDNLNRPITELFITIVNKGYMGWFNQPYNLNSTSALEIGWDFNFKRNSIDSWWNKSNQNNKDNIPFASYTRTGDNGNNINFYYNEDLPMGSVIKGDICEWNIYNQQETVVSKLSHKFSYNPVIFSTNGGSTVSPFGYAYQPHHSIPIRVYSDYIETGDKSKVSGIPDYSYYSEFEGQWRWRDIYLYGYIDTSNNGVNYPFINNRHYPFSKILFLQTPMTKNNNVYNDIIFSPTTDDCE